MKTSNLIDLQEKIAKINKNFDGVVISNNDQLDIFIDLRRQFRDIEKKIDSINLFVGRDDFDYLCERFDVVEHLIKELLENKYNDYKAIFDSNNYNIIITEINHYLDNTLKNKLIEFGFYFDKINLIIEIIKLFVNLKPPLKEMQLKLIDGDLATIQNILNDIDVVENNLKSSEFDRIFLTIPLDFINKVIVILESYLNQKYFLNDEFLETIRNFNLISSDKGNLDKYHKYMYDKELDDAVSIFDKSKKINDLEFFLNEKISRINDFKSIEEVLIKDHIDNNGKINIAIKEIESLLENSRKDVQQIKTEKGAVLQYSEELKNTDAVKVYSDLYASELKTAAWFRFSALLIFCIFSLIAIICLTALFFFDNESQIVKNLIDTKKIIAKMPFILAFFIFGFYLAREGEKHRRIANQAKQTEAELIALASYTNGWDSSDIKELKIKLADKYFGKTLYETEKATSTDSEIISNLIQQTKSTTELIKIIQTSESKSSEKEGKININ